jgi:hypothetical protein
MATSAYALASNPLDMTSGLQLHDTSGPSLTKNFGAYVWGQGRADSEDAHVFFVGRIQGNKSEIRRLGTFDVLHANLTIGDYIICDANYLLVIPDAEITAKNLDLPAAIPDIWFYPSDRL